MCVMMGGRVAEAMVFNRVTTGAQNDLKKITDLAYAQVQEFGMDDSIGLISFNREEVKSKRRKPFSKNLSALIDQQTRILLSDVYKTTESILRTHRNKLEIVIIYGQFSTMIIVSHYKIILKGNNISELITENLKFFFEFVN